MIALQLFRLFAVSCGIWRYQMGKKLVFFLLPVLLSVAGISARANASVINADITDLGSGNYRYTFDFSQLTLFANEEVEIEFAQNLFSLLFNGVAGIDFSLNLFQPNVPPGVHGSYSALATVNNPSLLGPFSVDVSFIGQGKPGSVPFLLNTFESPTGLYISTVDSGYLTISGVPEPGTLLLFAVASALGGAFCHRR